MEFDLPRGIVIVQEILLIVLYSTIGFRVWKQRTHQCVPQKFICSLYLGVLWIAVGVVGQALGTVMATLHFWGGEVTIRLLLWEIGSIGFFVGAFYALRYNFQSFEEFYQTEATKELDRVLARGSNE